MIVVDASIAVKWTVSEPGRGDALRILDRHEELAAPDLLLPEVSNVFRKKLKLGEVSEHQFDAAIAAIKVAIQRFVPSIDLVDDAVLLSRSLDHATYDCFYLACALPLGRLVTADEMFAAKCRDNGFGSFVIAAKDLANDIREGTPIGLKVDASAIDTVERLSRKMEETFDHLKDSATAAGESDEFRFISSEVFRPGFDSPAFLRLEKELLALDDDELASLLALGWLGRSYYVAEEWPELLSNARGLVAEGRDRHMTYFMSQMPRVSHGFDKLKIANVPETGS